MVPPPRILVNKKTEDAHDNPVMSIDDQGYIWVFSNAHGTSRPAYISRSDKPYSIDAFTQLRETNFSYGHPWFVPGQGFFFLHTIYQDGGRSLFWTTSRDGKEWAVDGKLIAPPITEWKNPALIHDYRGGGQAGFPQDSGLR